MNDDAPPDFPPDVGPARLVLVLDVLGRTVRVDALAHAAFLAALAAWERQVQEKVAKAGEGPAATTTKRKPAAGPGLFGGP